MADAVCVNIGPRQRRLRMRMGIVMFAVSAALAIAMAAMDANRLVRGILFVPLLLGSLGLLQARAHTCVALAAKGLRNMDLGNERVGEAEAAALKTKARGIWIQAIAVAGLLAAVAMAV